MGSGDNMKILIVPDSFKGTMSSEKVCKVIKDSLLEENGGLDIECLPFADGGEGFCESFANFCKGDMLYSNCCDIYGRNKKCRYFAFGDTAVIECAQASGLQKKKDVMNASSYGTGELIKSAYNAGFRNIILGLGGTGCCDGGAGALSALGSVFKDIEGNDIDFPVGADLLNIYGVNFRECVKGINFTFACDVENTYFGKNGAAYVFAPQKGADKSQVKELDDGLKMLNAFLPRDVSKVKGAGAAGGICGALYSVYGGEIKSGFDVLAEYSDLERRIKGANLIITGEGKTDRQTLMGKLPYKIAELCKKHGKPCTVISGSIENVKIGDRMISLVDSQTNAEQAINNAEKTLYIKSKKILQ